MREKWAAERVRVPASVLCFDRCHHARIPFDRRVSNTLEARGEYHRTQKTRWMSQRTSTRAPSFSHFGGQCYSELPAAKLGKKSPSSAESSHPPAVKATLATQWIHNFYHTYTTPGPNPGTNPRTAPCQPRAGKERYNGVRTRFTVRKFETALHGIRLGGGDRDALVFSLPQRQPEVTPDLHEGYP